jgi:hypothetical protein
LTRAQISSTFDNVKFFSNKALSDWISDNYVETFIIRVKDIGFFTSSDGSEHKYPMVDVHPIRNATPICDDADYSALESQVGCASSDDNCSTCSDDVE